MFFRSYFDLKVNFEVGGVLIKSQTAGAITTANINTALASIAVSGSTTKKYDSYIMEEVSSSVMSYNYDTALSFYTEAFVPKSLQSELMTIVKQVATETYTTYTNLDVVWLKQEDVLIDTGNVVKISVALTNEGAVIDYSCIAAFDVAKLNTKITESTTLKDFIAIKVPTTAQFETMKRIEETMSFFVDSEMSLTQAEEALSILRDMYYANLPGPG